MALQIQYRRDTAANWASANPVLLAGEAGLETDTRQVKFGNGTTAWNSLSYTVKTPPSGTVVGTSDTQTLTGKTINLSSNTLVATSAQLLAAVTDETGSGSLVFNTSPTLSSPTINGTVPGTTTFTNISATSIAATIGAGFQNMQVYTTGTGATWNLPAALQVDGAKFKVTIIGGGGQGGGTAATAGQQGGGGGGGSACIVFLTYVAGQTTLTYTVGAGGSGAAANVAGNAGGASTVVYNSITYTANGGGGGPTAATGGGGAGGTSTSGTLNIPGKPGGYGGTVAATNSIVGMGGDGPLGLGFGGQQNNAVTASTPGSGYGGGGSGAHNGATATAAAGGAGAPGVIIIEY